MSSIPPAGPNPTNAVASTSQSTSKKRERPTVGQQSLPHLSSLSSHRFDGPESSGSESDGGQPPSRKRARVLSSSAQSASLTAASSSAAAPLPAATAETSSSSSSAAVPAPAPTTSSSSSSSSVADPAPAAMTATSSSSSQTAFQLPPFYNYVLLPPPPPFYHVPLAPLPPFYNHVSPAQLVAASAPTPTTATSSSSSQTEFVLPTLYDPVSPAASSAWSFQTPPPQPPVPQPPVPLNRANVPIAPTRLNAEDERRHQEYLEGQRRIAIWNKKAKRKISGFTAPMKKNLEAYLKKNPHCEVYIPYAQRKLRAKEINNSTDQSNSSSLTSTTAASAAIPIASPASASIVAAQSMGARASDDMTIAPAPRPAILDAAIVPFSSSITATATAAAASTSLAQGTESAVPAMNAMYVPPIASHSTSSTPPVGQNTTQPQPQATQIEQALEHQRYMQNFVGIYGLLTQLFARSIPNQGVPSPMPQPPIVNPFASLIAASSPAAPARPTVPNTSSSNSTESSGAYPNGGAGVR